MPDTRPATPIVSGKALRTRRLAKLWTLRDLAARCAELGHPVDHSTLARYEHGQQPRLQKRRVLVPVLAQALDATVDELRQEPAA